jgi:DNA-binding transcriptional MerR regulator
MAECRHGIEEDWCNACKEPIAHRQPTPEGLSSRQVCEAVGITFRQLDYWVRQGTLVPSNAQAKGSGTQRRWSVDDAEQAAMLRVVLDMGIGARLVRKAVETAREAEGRRWLVVWEAKGAGAAARAVDHLDLDELGACSGFRVIDLDRVRQDLNEGLDSVGYRPESPAAV